MDVLPALSGIVFASVTGIALVLVLGRVYRWRPALRVLLAAVCALPLTVPVLLFALLAGYLAPLQNFIADSEVNTLERHLYAGESRAEIERQFGHAIPRPDRLYGYAVTLEEAEALGSARHLGQYAYAAKSAFCITEYRGIAVYYDVHDRVKYWKHFGAGDGC